MGKTFGDLACLASQSESLDILACKRKTWRRKENAKNSSQKEIAIIDWIFNAWGEKYNEGNDDDVVPTNIAKLLKIPVFYPKIVMEGGSIDVNGKGTLLTTRQCLLNENRNPDLTKKDLEIVLKNY